MNRSVTGTMYEVLGRVTWALNKRRFKQRVTHGPSARVVAIGLLAIGVVGIGAVAARAGIAE